MGQLYSLALRLRRGAPEESWRDVAVDAVLDSAVRLCRVVNAVLRRLPRWWWIVWLRVRVLTLQQPVLRLATMRQLKVLPPTGIHGDAIDIAQFGRFCKHAFNMFRLSPRTKLLRRLCLELGSRRRNNADLHWLMADVLVMQQPDTDGSDAEDEIVDANDLIEAQRRLDTLPQAPELAEYERQLKQSQEAAEIAGPTRRRMAEGIAKKRGLEPSDEEVIRQIVDVERKRRRQREEQAAAAAALYKRLGANPVHQQWVRAHAVWQKHVEPIMAQFRSADREIGETRHSRGTSFEEWARQDAFELVAARLEGDGPGQSVVRRDNWDWVDARGRRVGEVDVVVTTRGADGVEGSPTALLELKAHTLDIPTGWWQQVRQQRAGHSLVPPHPSNSGHRPQRRVAADNVPVFVVTTIPLHRYVMGASMEIVQRMGRHFGNEFRGVNPKANPEHRDPAELEAIARQIQKEVFPDEAESDPAARAAPLDFLRRDQERRVLFIV
mmetsp:Transcript_6777/g.20135  ORF Transcript_6777/g.20135 Transcript_6777/m.20135 type:complete len:495 (-) Transcript_6777:37-1521(-)